MNLDKLRKLVNEACDQLDQESEKASGSKMARTDLVTIAKDAQELVNMFGDDAELPDWVESKLTKASDYLNSVKKYIGGEIVRQHGGLMEEKEELNEDYQTQQRIADAATNAIDRTEEFKRLIPGPRTQMEFLNLIHGTITTRLRQFQKEEEDYSEDDYLEESYFHITDATYENGDLVEEDMEFWDDIIVEAEYRGRKVKLNKPTRGDVKKFKVYVRDPKTGNVKKVNFGDKKMRIKKSNPKRRKSFRARHNCDNPGPKTKARYWSCRKW